MEYPKYPICEYQQGDWLFPYGSNTPDRIRDVSYQEEPAGIWCIFTFIHNRSVWHYPAYCKPVPITREILKKNGFVETKTNQSYSLFDVITDNPDKFFTIRCYDDGDFRLYAGDDTVPTKRIEMNIKYVHEIQHELKSCEIEKSIYL